MWVSSAETTWVIHLRETRSSMISTVIPQVVKWVESLIHIELGLYVAHAGKGRRLERDGRGGCLKRRWWLFSTRRTVEADTQNSPL